MRRARKSTILLDDPRVEHFWTETRDLGRAFQEPIGLQGPPAWDVYLLYPRGVKWSGSPPTPEFFMHQLHELPGDRMLDARELAERVKVLLRTGVHDD